MAKKNKRRSRKHEYIQPPSERRSNKQRPVRRERTVQTRSAASAAGRRGQRRPMTVPEPSIKRTLRLIALYWVLFLVLQYFLNGSVKGMSSEQRILNSFAIATLFAVAFAPMLHWMERMRWKRFQRASSRGRTGDE